MMTLESMASLRDLAIAKHESRQSLIEVLDRHKSDALALRAATSLYRSDYHAHLMALRSLVA